MSRLGDAPLRIEPRASRALAVFLILSHGAGMITVLALPVALPVRLALSLLVALALAYGIGTYVVRHGRSAVTAVELDSSGAWCLFTANGVIENARLQGSSFVRPWLVVLNFSVGRLKRRTVILLPDAANADVLRRLRVRLRIAPQAQG